MAKRELFLSRLRRLVGCRKGQGVVEFTFGFLIFFAFFMAIVEFSHLLYAKVTLQHALRTAGRVMVTGKQGTGSGALPRDEMVHDVFCANIIAAGVQCPALGSGNFKFECIDKMTGNIITCQTAEGGSGGPDQTVMLTVNLSKPTLLPFFSQFFPTGGVPFQIGTTWKNEPFPTT